MRVIDLAGQRFHSLVVVSKSARKSYRNGATHTAWECICDCGTRTVVETQKLRSGHSKSCGCLKGAPWAPGMRFGSLTTVRRLDGRKWLLACDCGRERIGHATNIYKMKSCGCHLVGAHPNQTHKMTGTGTYQSWSAAKTRCHNKANPKYKSYGALGISMCDEWRNSFEAFYRDMGPRPPGHTLERNDVRKNYEPSNCRWIPAAQQAENKRDTLQYEGKTIKQIARDRGLSYYTVRAAMKRGANPLTFVPRGQ